MRRSRVESLLQTASALIDAAQLEVGSSQQAKILEQAIAALAQEDARSGPSVRLHYLNALAYYNHPDQSSERRKLVRAHLEAALSLEPDHQLALMLLQQHCF